MKACILVPKNPYAYRGGDTVVFRTLVEQLTAMADVSVIALDDTTARSDPIPFESVPKPPLRRTTLAVRSIASGRSLLHTRFYSRALAEAIRSSDADVFIAEHTYMAETFTRLSSTPYVVHSHGIESQIFGARRDICRPLRAAESRRIWSDEVRCMKGATAVSCLGADDARNIRRHGIEATPLEIVLEPKQLPARSTERNVLFLGDRRWQPNFDALREAERLWPSIRAAVPDARLLVAGGGPYPTHKDVPGITRLGFVKDLEDLWAQTRALFAPVLVGGGVRVKILDAARRGVPVVTTPSGLGSIGDYLPVRAYSRDAELVHQVVLLLQEDKQARSEGAALWDANRTVWQSGRLRQQLAASLAV